jgi:uncharacterized protein (TIGR03083 family)
VAARDLTAPVPNCPEWTVDDLVRHVAAVYLHKAECIRQQKFPDPWPPDLSGEPALALLDRAYAELTAEFAAHKPEEPAATWYEPDQTVGFWIRRMAHETVIHRVDAEQAVNGSSASPGAAPGTGIFVEPLAEIPEDLALDGVDEVLERFLSYGSVAWHDDFEAKLPSVVLPPVLVRAGEREWLVRPTPDGVQLEPAVADAFVAATIAGDPVPVLLWLWRRADHGVSRNGDTAMIDLLHTLLGDATQ